jgi:hypothetical protein
MLSIKPWLRRLDASNLQVKMQLPILPKPPRRGMAGTKIRAANGKRKSAPIAASKGTRPRTATSSKRKRRTRRRPKERQLSPPLLIQRVQIPLQRQLWQGFPPMR